MSANWGSYVQDVTIGSTIASPASDQTAEYSNDPNKQHAVAISVTYGGTYDGPAIARVLRRSATAAYANQANAEQSYPLTPTGGASTTATRIFSVLADVDAFVINIDNQSGATITGVTVHLKEGTLPS